jgi:hypothetical protein
LAVDMVTPPTVSVAVLGVAAAVVDRAPAVGAATTTEGTLVTLRGAAAGLVVVGDKGRVWQAEQSKSASRKTG